VGGLGEIFDEGLVVFSWEGDAEEFDKFFAFEFK